jgi:hypothetical protein
MESCYQEKLKLIVRVEWWSMTILTIAMQNFFGTITLERMTIALCGSSSFPQVGVI